MRQSIGCVSVLVRDYDEAIGYYTRVLGLRLVQDEVVAEGKRWVRVAPVGAAEGSLLLAKAKNEEERSAVGRQTGGRVFLFLQTDDFWRDYHVFVERGVRFAESPREEAYGTVAVFEDLYGNRWDLVQMRKTPGQSVEPTPAVAVDHGARQQRRADPMKKAQLVSSAPVLLVREVVAAAHHYRDVLGFTYDRFWGHPPKFVILHRDGMRLMLNQAPRGVAIVPHWKVDSGIWNVYFWTDDVEALFAEFRDRGARIDYGLEDKPYDVREFGIQDLDGYDIGFGQPLPRKA